MIRRISHKKYEVFAMDIESHNDEESISKQETSMWLGSFINENSSIDDESSYFYNMQEFFDRLELLSSAKRKKVKGIFQKRPTINLCIYIYNLSFEWSFMLPELIKRGFKFKENITKDDEFVFNSVSTKTVSSVWLINMKFGKKSGTIIFRDLAKLFGGGLANVAKAFGLPTQKGEIDYRKNRLHNYTITKEEKEYCFKDTKILMDILEIMNNRDDKDFWNSCSMASYTMKRMLKSAYSRSTRPFLKYRENYPELSPEENEFLRHSVSGGITYAPSLYQYKDIKQKVLHIDAHQMHPSQMFVKDFPYGEGVYRKGKPQSYFKTINCCRIKISYSDVKLHSIIQLIGIDSIEDYELTVWDFEIPTMYKCYVDLEIEYLDYYQFQCKKLPFRKYIANNYNERLKAKANKDAFGTLYYKLLNNSAYGKFIEKPHNEIFMNIIDDNDRINSEIVDKPEIKVNAKYTYIPIGSCIPAYSRVNLIEKALLFGWEKVVYFDTDSIFVIYDEKTKAIWEDDKLFDKTDFLGGWGLEEISDRSQFTAPKRYKLETDGKTTIKAGGINFKDYIDRQAAINHIDAKNYMVDFDEINIISSSWMVQRAYRVKGGTLIEFQQKDIKIPEKYRHIYNKNVKME